MRQKEVVINDDQFLISPLKNRWSALRAASEKAARQGDRFRFSSELVRVERIELSSQVWKTCILAVVLHPQVCIEYNYTRGSKANTDMFHKRNKLNKRLMQVESADDVVRSHAYSRVAGRSSSVPVRRTPTRGQAASGYRDSMVGSMTQYREKIVPQLRPDTTAPTPQQGSVIGNRPASSTAEQKHRFAEPPKRNFNRFG